MIVRCLEYKGITLDVKANADDFADHAEISGYALESVEFLTNAGIFNGDSSYNFNPKANATRAEVAKVLGILLEK